MKSIKCENIVAAFNVLKSAKLGGMTDSAKINVVRSVRELKNVAKDFEDFRTDCLESLKGEKHDEMVALANKWQQEVHDGKEISLTEEQRKEVDAYFIGYQKNVSDALKEAAEKVHELDIRTISEEEFAKLLSANDFNVEQIMLMQDILED